MKRQTLFSVLTKFKKYNRFTIVGALATNPYLEDVSFNELQTYDELLEREVLTAEFYTTEDDKDIIVIRIDDYYDSIYKNDLYAKWHRIINEGLLY